METNNNIKFWEGFFKDAGFEIESSKDFSVLFNNHRLTKDMLAYITKEYLIDMGINTIGDIILIQKQAKLLFEKENTRLTLRPFKKEINADVSMDSMEIETPFNAQPLLLPSAPLTTPIIKHAQPKSTIVMTSNRDSKSIGIQHSSSSSRLNQHHHDTMVGVPRQALSHSKNGREKMQSVVSRNPPVSPVNSNLVINKTLPAKKFSPTANQLNPVNHGARSPSKKLYQKVTTRVETVSEGLFASLSSGYGGRGRFHGTAARDVRARLGLQGGASPSAFQGHPSSPSQMTTIKKKTQITKLIDEVDYDDSLKLQRRPSLSLGKPNFIINRSLTTSGQLGGRKNVVSEPSRRHIEITQADHVGSNNGRYAAPNPLQRDLAPVRYLTSKKRNLLNTKNLLAGSNRLRSTFPRENVAAQVRKLRSRGFKTIGGSRIVGPNFSNRNNSPLSSRPNSVFKRLGRSSVHGRLG